MRHSERRIEMRDHLKIVIFLVIALVLLHPSSHSSFVTEEKAQLRVLFIGNSYTYFNNLPQLVSELSLSAKQGKPIEAKMVAIGGATLKSLWEEGSALEAIKQEEWDYIVLQEQSTLGPARIINGALQINDPKTFHEYARLFNAEIRKAGAQTILYMTWPRQNRPEMQETLTDAYLSIGKELEAIVSPVGLAWEAVLKDQPQFALYMQDKSHPAPAGSYLTACVFYATIYGQSPEGLTGRILGSPINMAGLIKADEPKSELVNLNVADASFLQKKAWQIVVKYRKTG